MTQTNKYFQSLLSLLTQIENKSYYERNSIWLAEYHRYLDDVDSKNIEAMPSIMTLIFPDFLFTSTGYSIKDLVQYDSPSFNKSIADTDNCQINKIDSDLICEFNNYRELRKKCQADHYWPYSLGGPTILENRVILCRFHNVAKSNSIMDNFWNTYPDWLNIYLTRIFNLKK